MSGRSRTIETDTRSLLTQQLAMFTTDRSVGGAKIPGLYRRGVVLSNARPPDAPDRRTWTGVKALDVNPFRGGFLDRQYRREESTLGASEVQKRILRQLEVTFSEPKGKTISDLMRKFWPSWALLAHGAAEAGRKQLLEQGRLLTNAFHRTSRALDGLTDRLERQIEMRTYQINEHAAKIADLNRRITETDAGGQVVSGLRDRRTLELDGLSRLAQVQIEETYTAAVHVCVGDTELVHANENRRLAAICGDRIGGRGLDVVWEYSGRSVPFSGGEVGGLIQARDTWLPETRSVLDALVKCLVTEVNGLHRQGVTREGRPATDFFDPLSLTARSVQLHGRIADNAGENIVVGRTAVDGDVGLARALAGLAERAVMPDGRSTLSGYYDAVASTLRTRRAAARDVTEAQNMLVKQLANHRQSVPGTSLDFEFANMIKLKHASEAAVRVITTMDEALNTVVNGMGIVSRLSSGVPGRVPCSY